MSRFSHLEFDPHRQPRKPQVVGEPIRDEHFFSDRAQTAWLAGDFEQALLNYSRSLEKRRTFYDGWFGQVRMLIELGEYREGKLWADKALELFPEHPELLAAKAIACARDAEFDKAQAYSDNAIEKRGVTWFVWVARAEVLLSRDSRMAEHCLANAVGLGGESSPLVRLEAGRLLIKFDRFSAALPYLRQAVNELPKAPLAWFALGCCLARLGMPEAENILAQCRKLRPQWNLPAQALQQFRARGIFAKILGACKRIFGR